MLLTLPVLASPISSVRAQESCTGDELTALRTRHRKVFRNADCSLTALFGHYLHYEAGPGQWQDIDLSLRREGSIHVMDRHDLKVRVTDSGVEALEQSNGKGIRWLTPARPVVAGRRVSYTDQGLVWDYFTRKTGLKLVSLVTTPRGPRTYEFDYQLLGNAAQLSEGPGGSLESDAFRIPRSVAIGKDLRLYEAGPWRLLAGNRVAFDFDDSQLPPKAFPYVLDPSTTFGALDVVDDGMVAKTGNTYPPDGVSPPQGSTRVDTIGTTISSSRSFSNGCVLGHYQPCYEISNALVRWDTSSLPDNATVTSASFNTYVTSASEGFEDPRNLTADWYTSWPIDLADYSESEATSALPGVGLSSIVSGSQSFSLSGPGAGVSKTGYSGLRLHISGSETEPGGINAVEFAAYDHTSLPEPQLEVTYNVPPSISSVSDSPDPVTAGSTVTFSAGWNDPGDQVRAAICKTSAIVEGATPSCPGGTWGVGSLSSTSPATATSATTAADIGVRSYYAFVCDLGGKCSSPLSGTFTVQNSPPSISSVTDSPDPVTAGNSLTFSVGWGDPNPGDQVRAVLCKTNQVTNGACASGQVWTTGNLGSTSPSAASLTPTAAHHGTNTYYAFACDAANSCSPSLSGIFTVQNRTPAITSASDSPDPVTAGGAVTFSVGWTDLGDQVKSVICKTNQVLDGACAAGQNWASGNPSSASPSTVSFTPTAANHGTNTYYAFACDVSACSSSLSGTFTVQNRTPSIVSISDSPDPANPGETVTFSVSWTDPDDSVRAIVCKTNWVSAGTCPGGAWVTGSPSSSSPSTASYTVSPSNWGSNTYYAFACDAQNACSSSFSGTFTVNNSSPSITSASDAPDPGTAGDSVTFTVGWSDANPGDQTRAVICKTNQVTNGLCPSGQTWSSGNLSSTSPSTASFTPTAAQHGTNTYYAFACDAANACSSSLSGSYTTQNRGPSIESASDSPDPVRIGHLLTFSVSWSDPGDAVRAVICKTNEVSGGSCPGGAWAIGAFSSSSPSTASFKTSRSDEGNQTYYAFACDASGLCSGSIADTFTAYPIPPVVVGVNEFDDGTAPLYAGEVLEFDVLFWQLEPEPEETHRALICRTPLLDRVNGGCEPGQQWTHGPLLRDGAKAWYQTAWNEVGIYTYYAFACDHHLVCSANWVEGTFEVVNRPPRDIVVTEYPDPVAPEGVLTFTVEWWDTVGDPVTPVICEVPHELSGGGRPYTCKYTQHVWATGPRTTSTGGRTTATLNMSVPWYFSGTYQYWAFACDSFGACQGAMNNPQTFTVDASGSTGYEGGSDPFAPRCEEETIFWGEFRGADNVWRQNAQGASDHIRETLRNMTYDCRGAAVAWSTTHVNLEFEPGYFVEFGWQIIRREGYAYDPRAFLEWGIGGEVQQKVLFPYPCPPFGDSFHKWVITNVQGTTHWNGRVGCDGGPTTLIGSTQQTGSTQGIPLGETGRRPAGKEETGMSDVHQLLEWKGAQQNWNFWTNPTCWDDNVSGWGGQAVLSNKYQVAPGTSNC